MVRAAQSLCRAAHPRTAEGLGRTRTCFLSVVDGLTPAMFPRVVTLSAKGLVVGITHDNGSDTSRCMCNGEGEGE